MVYMAKAIRRGTALHQAKLAGEGTDPSDWVGDAAMLIINGSVVAALVTVLLST
jgi:hypothetical protein